MAGPRCFVEGVLRAGETLTLSAEERHHLTRVLRVREGGAVTLLNGAGAVAQGVLVADGRGASVSVEAVQTRPPPAVALHWLQALPKGRLMDTLVRQAVELGVRRIVPVTSDHCDVRLEADSKRPQAKRERWRQAAIEAMKQSGTAWLPAIEPVQPLKTFLASRRASTAGEALLVASLEAGAERLAGVLAQLPRTTTAVTVAVGPEGDFSREEYAALRLQGGLPVRLGESVLRVETAAVYALSVADQWRCSHADASIGE
ncbi:MAG: RsmE family RNA methyltransferase [Opitutales bacterium]